MMHTQDHFMDTLHMQAVPFHSFPSEGARPQDAWLLLGLLFWHVLADLYTGHIGKLTRVY